MELQCNTKNRVTKAVLVRRAKLPKLKDEFMSVGTIILIILILILLGGLGGSPFYGTGYYGGGGLGLIIVILLILVLMGQI